MWRLKNMLIFVCIHTTLAIGMEGALPDVLDAFSKVGRLPIKSKEGDDLCVAQQMKIITNNDGDIQLQQQHRVQYKHYKNFILWTFFKLPQDLQEKVVEKMMNYNKKAKEIFIKTPFVYALNRLVSVTSLQKKHFRNRDVDDLFTSTIRLSSVHSCMEKTIVQSLDEIQEKKNSFYISFMPWLTTAFIVTGVITYKIAGFNHVAQLVTAPCVLAGICAGSIFGLYMQKKCRGEEVVVYEEIG